MTWDEKTDANQKFEKRFSISLKKIMSNQINWHLQPKGLINLDQHNSNISVIEGVFKENNEATCWMDLVIKDLES